MAQFGIRLYTLNKHEVGLLASPIAQAVRFAIFVAFPMTERVKVLVNLLWAICA